MNEGNQDLSKHGTINSSNSRFCTMRVMTYIGFFCLFILWYNLRSSDSLQLQFVFSLIVFFLMSSAKHHKWTILYSSNVIYKKRGRGVLQICSTVHIIAILRIYRRSLINSNKPGGGGGVREKLYETSIAIKSQNSCHGNPTLLCSFIHHLHSQLTNDA